MRVSVFGLGYVGCVLAACLASMGHEVVGVDVNPVKVDLVNDGKAPVVEERIGELIAEVVGSGALRATTDQVMDVFLADRKLNISPAYLRPGFAFGGSCLPKDLRSLVHAAHRADVAVPILSHVLPSNEEHLQRAVELLKSVALFADLEGAELERFSHVAVPRSFPAGTARCDQRHARMKVVEAAVVFAGFGHEIWARA